MAARAEISTGKRKAMSATIAPLAFVLAMAYGMGAIAATTFPIQESGYWSCEDARDRCVYWLDNERIIFNGSDPSDTESTSDGRQVWRHAIDTCT